VPKLVYDFAEGNKDLRDLRRVKIDGEFCPSDQ